MGLILVLQKVPLMASETWELVAVGEGPINSFYCLGNSSFMGKEPPVTDTAHVIPSNITCYDKPGGAPC